MADIRPIEFETSSLQMLQSLGEKRQREYLLEQKRMQEELEQKRELMNMVNPITLSKNLESEVANATLNNLKGGITSWLRQNPNASSGELQNKIQSDLGELSAWNAKVKTIKERIDNAIKDMPQDKTINRSALRSAAISKALYNPNTGTLKNVNELDDQTDFVSDIWNTGGSRVINISETDADLRKEIGAQPMSEKDVTITTLDPKANRRITTQQRTKAANYMQWDDKKNKFDIKRGADGLIDNSVYASFIGDPGSARDKMFEFRAEQEIKSGRAGMQLLDVFNPDGSLKDPAALDYTKKRLVGDFIVSNSPISQVNKDIQGTINRISVINKGADVSKAGFDWISSMDTAMKNKDINSIKEYLNALYGGGGKKVISTDVVGNNIVVNYEGDVDKRQMIQVGGKWQVNPNEGKATTETITFDITSPNAVQRAGGLYQKMMGSDRLVEGYVVKKSGKKQGAKSLN